LDRAAVFRFDFALVFVPELICIVVVDGMALDVAMAVVVSWAVRVDGRWITVSPRWFVVVVLEEELVALTLTDDDEEGLGMALDIALDIALDVAVGAEVVVVGLVGITGLEPLEPLMPLEPLPIWLFDAMFIEVEAAVEVAVVAVDMVADIDVDAVAVEQDAGTELELCFFFFFLRFDPFLGDVSVDGAATWSTLCALPSE